MELSGVSLPPPVAPGDRVGIAALSGPIVPGRVERGAAELERLGFEPVLAANLGSRHGLFAGSDDQRLAAFHELAADPSVRAIVFARGGSGLLRVLPRIDWDLLARHPRAYVGYSDLTPFLLAVVERLGRVAFHGPMAAADLARPHRSGGRLGPDEERSFLDALAGRLDGASYPLAGWLREGVAEGPLLGGCLSLLTSVQGTDWAPRLDGSILFWEDVEEPLYRLDRMLTHLDLSGNLTAIRGMVIGHCRPSDAPSGVGSGDGWLGQLSEVFERYPWPVAYGLPAGHEAPNLTLPLGLPALLDPKSGTLTVRTR